jgi:hypothetical protein
MNFVSVPFSAKETSVTIAAMGVGHYPLIKGNKKNVYVVSRGAEKVQYRIFLIERSDNEVKELTDGYTDSVEAYKPYLLEHNESFTTGSYILKVWVKEEGSNNEYDYERISYLYCNENEDNSKLYVDKDMDIDKLSNDKDENEYMVGETLIIKGIKDIGGKEEPYKYRLHIYDVDRDKWIIDDKEYRDICEWTPDKPGTYILDLWVISSDPYYLNAIEKDPLGKVYEGWNLKVINVNPEPEKVDINMAAVDHLPIAAGDSASFFITSKNVDKVQYRVWLYSPEKSDSDIEKLKEITNGYSHVMPANEPFEIKVSDKMDSGKYRLWIWVREEGSHELYDKSYGSDFQCIEKDGVVNINLDNKMDIEKGNYIAGEKIVIHGIQDDEGINKEDNTEDTSKENNSESVLENNTENKDESVDERVVDKNNTESSDGVIDQQLSESIDNSSDEIIEKVSTKDLQQNDNKYLYKLHILNIQTREWIIDDKEYRKVIEWIPEEAGLYLLDLWILDPNSELGSIIKNNPNSKVFNGLKLQLIDVKKGKNKEDDKKDIEDKYTVINNFDELIKGIENGYNLKINNSKVQEVYDKANEIIKNIITENMTELEKELVIHNYIIKNTRYDDENYEMDSIPDDSYTPYGALIKGVAVCDGYTKSMKILLNMVGIESDIVKGDTIVGGNRVNHSWNLVKIEGEYYHVDATWNDPIPDAGDKVRYSYFNMTDEELEQDHVWNKDRYRRAVRDKYEYLHSMYHSIISDEWIYYSDLLDDNKLYKIKIDGTDKVKLRNSKSIFITVDDEWIYYSNYSHGGYIYKIRKDGIGNIKLNDEWSTDIKIKDDWIYYKSVYENKGYKIKKDGTERQVVTVENE